MPIFDLHSHFSFKPANSRSPNGQTPPDKDHWCERFKDKKAWSKFIAKFDKEVIKSSQLHGNAATEGGFRLIVNGLYPLEHGFTTKTLNHALATLVGYDTAVLEAIYESKISYFQLLEREYRNLLAGQRETRNSAAGNSYKVVDSFGEIERTLAAAPDTICIVNSIEGAHAFADVLFDRQGRFVSIYKAEKDFVRRNTGRDGTSWFELHIEAVLANIDKVKTNWEHTPLFVTLAHHFYNHICGHSPSISGIFLETAVQQHGGASNQTGYDTSYFFLGIRPWGLRILSHMLKRENSRGEKVRRILVDTKHMSPQARLDYYSQVVDQRLKYFNDRIPIVVSHTAVNGRKSLTRFKDNINAVFPDEKASSKYFHAGAINLFDDEIKRVVESGGIMGLMIDERRIMGEELPPEAGMTYKVFKEVAKRNKKNLGHWTELRQKHAWGYLNDSVFTQQNEQVLNTMRPLLDQLRPAYLSVIFRQLFHIMDLVQERGWDHVALGTDYDGVINPIDLYPQSSDMKTLQKDLVDFWESRLGSNDLAVATVYSKHLYGKKPLYWVKKLLWGNGMEFLRKYYNDGYLLNGVVA